MFHTGRGKHCGGSGVSSAFGAGIGSVVRTDTKIVDRACLWAGTGVYPLGGTCLASRKEGCVWEG